MVGYDELPEAIRLMTSVTDAQILADVSAAVAFLQADAAVDGARIGITGFCMGGRISFLSACNVPAIKAALDRSGLSLGSIDLIEINEAFAPQYLACERELELDRSKVNVDGGAIALGHPLAASGARITAHLVHELRRRNGKHAVGSACIGGGQGIALVLERA